MRPVTEVEGHPVRLAMVQWEEGDIRLPALVRLDASWNGFLYPYFERGAIDAYRQWCGLADGEYATVEWADNGTTLHVWEQGDEYDIEPVDGLYPLGAGAWTWQEVEA